MNAATEHKSVWSYLSRHLSEAQARMLTRSVVLDVVGERPLRTHTHSDGTTAHVLNRQGLLRYVEPDHWRPTAAGKFVALELAR